MVKRSRTPAANSRNSQRSLRNQRARRRYGSETPTDEQIRAQAASDRGQAFSRARVAAAEAKKKPKAKPKSPTGTAQPQKKKQPTKKVKPTKEKPSFDKYLSEQTPSNARNAIDNASGRGNTSGRITSRDSYTSSGRRTRKSLDTLQGTFQGMLTILKLNRAPHKTSRKLTTEGEHSGTGVKGGNTQFEGTQIMERNRGDRTVIRDPTGKPKERKAGRLNYQTTTGGASTLKATTCRLWKTELNETFNTLLDNFQDLYKTYEDDKFNEAEGKGKKPKITNTGRRGRGSLGGDTQATPPAMGTTRSDQQVMQS
jgi:hypothetical protein